VTRTDVTLLRLSTEDALDILEDHFGLASDVLAGMAARWLWGIQNAPSGETNGTRSRPGGERA
jgi:hypothetical protein